MVLRNRKNGKEVVVKIGNSIFRLNFLHYIEDPKDKYDTRSLVIKDEFEVIDIE